MDLNKIAVAIEGIVLVAAIIFLVFVVFSTIYYLIFFDHTSQIPNAKDELRA
jgi:hypothetical protein